MNLVENCFCITLLTTHVYPDVRSLYYHRRKPVANLSVDVSKIQHSYPVTAIRQFWTQLVKASLIQTKDILVSIQQSTAVLFSDNFNQPLCR